MQIENKMQKNTQLKIQNGKIKFFQTPVTIIIQHTIQSIFPYTNSENTVISASLTKGGVKHSNHPHKKKMYIKHFLQLNVSSI